MSLQALLRTKSIEQLQSELGRAGQFRRVLGLWQLTAIGLGGLIGAGIFVLTGVVAATQAGPAVSLSFVIAGIASAAAALCYAEFAGMIPVAGSAYTYGYAVLGELVAWVIGWDLLLEYALVVAVVSIGWSGYLQALLNQLGITLPTWAIGAPGTGPGQVLDLPAMLGSLAVAGLLTLRIEWGARFNMTMVIIKIAAVVLVIAAGLPHVHTANWHPFMPYGFGGVAEGAAVVFFAVFGYDTLTTAAEESRDPQQQLPRAVLLSLAISLVLYIAMSLVLTGVVRYDTLNGAAPVAAAFTAIGLPWVTLFVSAAAVAGIASVMLAFMLGCARIWFAMSRDGLLPGWFAQVHPRFRTP
ncbi:MAG: amino acid permease, partial [Methylocella sp.]